MLTIKVKESKYMRGDYSLFLSFPYNEKMINIIRGFSERSWIKQSKEWEVPLDMLEELLDIFSNQDIEIEGRYIDLTPRAEITSIEYNFKTTPFEHQKVSFLYGMNHDRWFLGDQMGLGKTKQAIDIAVALKEQRGFKHCLIICGVNGLKWNWRNEIATHSNEEAHILGQKIKKKTGEIYIGSNKDKLYDVEHLESISAYFIITNVETLRDDKIVAGLSQIFTSKTMCVYDECHKGLKGNPNASQQGKGILKLQPEYRLAMTGTPLMNTPLDLYGILRWLGVEKHAFYTFKNYYAIMGGYGGYEVVGYKHLEELQEQFDSIMLRRLKEEVLDLPEKTYIDEYVDMLPKQAVIYKEVKADIQANIDMLQVSPNPLAQMIRLRQATGYTGILSSEIQCSAKLDRMEELVEDIIENNQKVVIFSNWTQITDIVIERLKKYTPLVITGQTSDEMRQKYVDAFQSESKYKVMIGTTGALGTGVTLTAATNVIMLDEPWSRALLEQAIDRVHRIGQKNNITIYTLLCKGTIDERIHSLVYKKGKISDALVDGEIKTNKQEVIDYLLS